MLIKDLFKIYKVYYIHASEVLERFVDFNHEDAMKAFEMYQNFVNLTDAMKKRALPLITNYGFPIRLPDFYIPE